MRRVLIIEDNEAFLSLFKTNLELEGFDVLTAAAVDEGVRMTRTSRPDLVILDLASSRIEEYRLFAELKSEDEFRELPVLILSPAGEEGDRIRALGLGGMEYLARPLTPRKLLKAVRSCMKDGGEPAEERDLLDIDYDITTVAVAGGGKEGLSLIQFLWGEPKVKLLAFTEDSQDDEAFRLAAKLGIHTTTVVADILRIPELEMIIALRHSEVLHLRKTRADLDILGENAARVLMDLVNEREAKVEQAREAAQSLAQRQKELSLINEVGNLFISISDLKEVLNKIVTLISRVTNSLLCTVMFFEKGVLKIGAASGATPFLTQDFVTPMERSVAEWVMENKAPLKVKDLATDEKFRHGEYSIKEDLRSVLAVPLSFHDKLVGILSIFMGVPHDFTREEMNLLSILAQQASIAIDNARTYMTLNELHQGFIRTFLEAMDSRDEYSHSHSVFVSCLCRRIAEEMALSAETVATLEQAALLHDLGKIAIPETILKKPGKLSEEEKSIVALHPVTAARILEKMELFKNLVPIILHQSERWDGKGKPRGLRSEEIPMGSRILCVAEAFDALISRRAYREAYSVEEAIEILLGGSGSLFDPNVLQALLALLKREPELRNRWVQEAQTAGRV